VVADLLKKQPEEYLNLWSRTRSCIWHQSESDANIFCLPSGWFLEQLVCKTVWHRSNRTHYRRKGAWV